MIFDNIYKARYWFRKYKPLKETVKYFPEVDSELKFGDYILFRHILSDGNMIGRPILGVFVGYKIWDQALAINYVEVPRAWMVSHEIITNHDIGYKMHIFGLDEEVQAIQFWTDNIKLIGHWKHKPKVKELRRVLTKEVFNIIPENPIVIGGNFCDDDTFLIKESSIIRNLAKALNSDVVNGGTLGTLRLATNLDQDLIIWGANVDNSIEKIYPRKPKGSVMIVTKVMRRDENDFGEAVSRIFKMAGNAVIAIDTSEKPFKFHLIDALGNKWISTSDLEILKETILKFYAWTKGSIRIGTKDLGEVFPVETPSTLNTLSDIVKDVAKKVENERGGRYFGNASTRCKKMFPTARGKQGGIWVSKRNTPKEYLDAGDFVFVTKDRKEIGYYGDKKPSVDTPIQLALYDKFPKINYIIHGHANIKYQFTTKDYYPCGDMREYESIIEGFEKSDYLYATGFRMNLKNHGFLICASSLEMLRMMAKRSTFEYKEIGKAIENE